MSQNPYSSPQNNPQSPYRSPNSQSGHDPADQLKIPAIFLIIFCVISILNILAGPFLKVGMGQQQLGSPEFIGGLVAAVLICVLQGVVLMAGVGMLSKKNYSLCKTGAIIACIPICTPCIILGIPFAVWSLVLLGKPEIQNSFQS